MVIGECPNCGEVVINGMPERSPAFDHTECDKCGKSYWIKLSRTESEAYTEEEFDRLYEVDEQTRIVKDRESRKA